jgi:nicotinamidase-related amidase
LIVVDIQNDYFPGGAHPLDRPEEAAGQARLLLDAFRRAGEPIVHVQHLSGEPDATFMRPGTEGVEIHPLVTPQDGEPVIQKAHPNSFLGTELEGTLRGLGVDAVVVCGMMTSMCVDATVRAAVDLGFDASVAHDACATLDLDFGGRTVPAADVHAAFLAALASAYARVAPAEELALGE